MRKVEKEEERSAMHNPEKQCFHLCIINLVIGTLYCSKVCGCAQAMQIPCIYTYYLLATAGQL